VPSAMGTAVGGTAYVPVPPVPVMSVTMPPPPPAAPAAALPSALPSALAPPSTADARLAKFEAYSAQLRALADAVGVAEAAVLRAAHPTRQVVCALVWDQVLQSRALSDSAAALTRSGSARKAPDAAADAIVVIDLEGIVCLGIVP
jgi:hypothetical protein